MRCALLFGFLLFFPLQAWAQDASQPLRIAITPDRPPFAYRTETGVLGGFDVSIAQAICQTLGRPCFITASMQESEAMEALRRGRIELIVAGVLRTPELEAVVEFSEPYYRSGSVFIARSGNVVESFINKCVGVLQHRNHRDYLEERPEEFNCLSVYPTLTGLWEMLVNGSVDAVFSSSVAGYAFLRSPEGREFDIVGKAISHHELPGEYRILMPKGQTQLHKDVNQALNAIRRNGHYVNIGYRYFGIPID